MKIKEKVFPTLILLINITGLLFFAWGYLEPDPQNPLELAGLVWKYYLAGVVLCLIGLWYISGLTFMRSDKLDAKPISSKKLSNIILMILLLSIAYIIRNPYTLPPTPLLFKVQLLAVCFIGLISCGINFSALKGKWPRSSIAVLMVYLFYFASGLYITEYILSKGIYPPLELLLINKWLLGVLLVVLFSYLLGISAMHLVRPPENAVYAAIGRVRASRKQADKVKGRVQASEASLKSLDVIKEYHDLFKPPEKKDGGKGGAANLDAFTGIVTKMLQDDLSTIKNELKSVLENQKVCKGDLEQLLKSQHAAPPQQGAEDGDKDGGKEEKAGGEGAGKGGDGKKDKKD